MVNVMLQALCLLAAHVTTYGIMPTSRARQVLSCVLLVIMCILLHTVFEDPDDERLIALKIPPEGWWGVLRLGQVKP